MCMLHASSMNLAGFHTCCMPITTCIQQSSVQLCWLTCSSLYACNPRWGWCNLRPPDSKRIPICDIFGKCNFPSLHEAIYFLHVTCMPIACNLHVYYMPAISSLHALCMLHVQLFQYACNLHFACAVTRMLLILALQTPIAIMLHVCPGIYALATQIPYLTALIITFHRWPDKCQIRPKAGRTPPNAGRTQHYRSLQRFWTATHYQGHIALTLHSYNILS